MVGGQRTARMASSNTVLRPRWVRAEHSKYLTAAGDRKIYIFFNITDTHFGERERGKKHLKWESLLQISLAIASPWGYVIGLSFFSFSFSIVSLSSLRSSLVPTRMMGVLGQWCLTSGYHCKDTNTYKWAICRLLKTECVNLNTNILLMMRETLDSRTLPDIFVVNPLLLNFSNCFLSPEQDAKDIFTKQNASIFYLKLSNISQKYKD